MIYGFLSSRMQMLLWGKNHNKKKETHIFRQNIRRKYVTIYKKYVNGWGINH